MAAALIGRKIGMTRYYDDQGRNVPVTIVQAGPCYVSQVKSASGPDGYSAVQIAFEDVKARNTTIPLIGHDMKAGVSPKRFHREFRVDESELENYEPGQPVTVAAFESIRFVDVIGTSKGKGFAGVMRRWKFKGLPATHGTERKHRSPGAIAGRSTDLGGGRPKKGIKMPGHMGQARVTERSLEIVAIDKDRNLLLIKGPIPGPNQGLVTIREATRLYKTKAAIAAQAT